MLTKSLFDVPPFTPFGSELDRLVVVNVLWDIKWKYRKIKDHELKILHCNKVYQALYLRVRLLIYIL